ncbi:MAG: glycerol acyltransferase [Prolixibacteraceae bacterium]|jgi:1-acyl-sn-glycerol-3-phosphate acyltransferase|nr:glycerol acyltransferase [Prolixibacteraceae bacterium]MBT6765033.1 glycerol acyltransferase [Prolixibacteraceae bacterium]MBT6999096.1 glycerol acyltransferase [Prolixibacteraceae bacterium]MBT7396164.1 glycerol acyltransferase [Prolixibacteraceae bacterium]
MQDYNFDDIRPYTDREARAKIRLLLKDPVFDEVLMHLFKVRPKVKMVKIQLRMIRNIRQLQGTFVYDFLRRIINRTSEGLSCFGIEKLDKKKPYLFISNHRDIVLDPALMNLLIFDKGMNTTQIAIGNNLLLYNWIEHAVKLNRSFVIKRDLGSRELLESSKKVSHYIRKSLLDDNVSVWIAQREGRTKDGSDKTQASVLKMLNMSNKKSFSEGVNELNIVPVSISYEIEPCGLAKMKELIKKEHYKKMKTSKDDLKSMSMGMFNPKGRMRFTFGDPIKIDFEKAKSTKEKNKQTQDLADLIDQQIYTNFKLWPNNYIAYDLLMQEHRFKDKYTGEEERNFEMMVEQAMIHIDFPITDITERFLKIYANPVINRLKVSSNL